MHFYGEFRWHKRSEEYYILDATHPQAFDYLRKVFRTWRRDWGCEYFKTDFMHFGSEYGPDRAVYHTAGFTRIEIWRKVGEMIRAEIGAALWLGCGCPLWAAVGLVDGIRTGRDMGVEWKTNARSLLGDQAARNFANGLFWQADPDCILLRQPYHFLTDSEVQALAIYAGMVGGVRMTSDHLGELPASRLDLWRLVLANGERATCRYPFLGAPCFLDEFTQTKTEARLRRESDGRSGTESVLVQVRPLTTAAGQEVGAVFLFNTGEEPVECSYPLKVLGLPAPLYTHEWLGSEETEKGEPHTRITAYLPAHTGRLFFVSPAPLPDIDRLPE